MATPNVPQTPDLALEAKQAPDIAGIVRAGPDQLRALSEGQKNEFLAAFAVLEDRIRQQSGDAEAGKLVYELRELTLQLEYDVKTDSTFEAMMKMVLQKREELRQRYPEIPELPAKINELWAAYEKASRKEHVVKSTREIHDQYQDQTTETHPQLIAEAKKRIVKALEAFSKKYLSGASGKDYAEFFEGNKDFTALFKGKFFGFASPKPLDAAGDAKLVGFLNKYPDAFQETMDAAERLRSGMIDEIRDVTHAREDQLLQDFRDTVDALTKHGKAVTRHLASFEEAFVEAYPQLLDKLQKRNEARLALETIRTYTSKLVTSGDTLPDVMTLQPDILATPGASETERNTAIARLKGHARGRVIDAVVSDLKTNIIEPVRVSGRYTGASQKSRMFGAITAKPLVESHAATKASEIPFEEKQEMLKRILDALKVSRDEYARKVSAIELAASRAKSLYQAAVVRMEQKHEDHAATAESVRRLTAEQGRLIQTQEQRLNVVDPDTDGGMAQYVEGKINDDKGEFMTQFVQVLTESSQWQSAKMGRLTELQEAKQEADATGRPLASILPDFDQLELDVLSRENIRHQKILDRLDKTGEMTNDKGEVVAIPRELNERIIATGIVPEGIRPRMLSLDAGRAFLQKNYREEFQKQIGEEIADINSVYNPQLLTMRTESVSAAKESHRAKAETERLRQVLLLYGNALQQVGALTMTLQTTTKLLEDMLSATAAAKHDALHGAFETLFDQHDLMAHMNAQISTEYQANLRSIAPLGDVHDVIRMLETPTVI